ncbi:hypothetical protein M121_4219 [Bacteroides fragilis str. 3783N2-1]|nr:hypothetical protein M121_4219 [Bacteroides fragilis str. 3783N2-1]EXZ16131.1 hypothetical protein M071_4530 [Bacteroides fragilis str. Ds-233]
MLIFYDMAYCQKIKEPYNKCIADLYWIPLIHRKKGNK